MARKPEKVIITCAITGSVHTPTMSVNIGGNTSHDVGAKPSQLGVI
jgi:hypothetical protein